MRLQRIEAWVLEIVDRALSSRKVEDDRVELQVVRMRACALANLRHHRVPGCHVEARAAVPCLSSDSRQ